jgi:hypothetical protein
LMISLPMIMRHELTDRLSQRAFSKQDQALQT